MIGNRQRAVITARLMFGRRLARTAHSIVDLAYDTWDEQEVVIKYLAPTHHGLALRKAARAFVREIEIVKALPDVGEGKWRYFPRYITKGHDQRGYYYVQSYISGQTLASILAAGRPHDALTIATNLCRVVRILHASGIIHSDLHPQNIIVGRYGEVALIDFELSRYRNQHAPELQGIGRPDSTPLEQLAGWPLDERSDFFALGHVLHELLDLDQLPPSTQRLIKQMRDPSLIKRRVTLATLQAELEDILRASSPLPQPSLSPFSSHLLIVIIAIFLILYLVILW